jgi:predicted RNA-binding Zn-ribbon protein involved in translation (DUF1610 family)
MAQTVEFPINWRILDLDCPECGRSLIREYSNCRGIPSKLKCDNFSCSLVERRYEWPTITLKIAEEDR